jgi:hypothetical protein
MALSNLEKQARWRARNIIPLTVAPRSRTGTGERDSAAHVACVSILPAISSRPRKTLPEHHG